MKKFVCIFVILAILSSCIFANAKTSDYTCKALIGLDAKKNVIDLEFTLDDDMSNEYFMVAFYTGGKIDKLERHSFSEIQDIVDSNDGVTDAKAKKYLSLEIKKTPDVVKVFAWDENFVPVYKEINLFETEDDLKAANKPVNDKLIAARDELKTVRWIEKKFKYASERKLCDLLISLSEDAISRDGELLFTKENAQKFYEKELNDVKDMYSLMTSTEKDHFRKSFANGRERFAPLEYLINFLEIKGILASV